MRDAAQAPRASGQPDPQSGINVDRGTLDTSQTGRLVFAPGANPVSQACAYQYADIQCTGKAATGGHQASPSTGSISGMGREKGRRGLCYHTGRECHINAANLSDQQRNVPIGAYAG
jgi:hypothetical protein